MRPPHSVLLSATSLLAPCLFALGLAGCSCGGEPAGCRTSTDCPSGQTCLDTRCQPLADAGPRDTGTDAPTDAGCGIDRRPCGTVCCGAGEVCGTHGACCARVELCGSTCCGAAEVCEGAICRLDCGGAARCRDAAGTESCCAAGEVCASGQCFLPVTSCTDFIDCAAGEYCEPSLGQCLPQPGGPECASHPTGGAVLPTLLWHWDGTGAALPTYRQVMMAPMVASLNDDDGDGDADRDDIPDIVFQTFAGGSYGADGVLRAVSGTDGSSVFDVVDPALRTIPGAQVAIGDLDGDGWNEIVTCASNGGAAGPVIAFRHDGTFFWRAPDPRAVCGQAAPAIADLDGDGQPEVFVHYTVLHGTDGSVAWHHDCVGTGGWATVAHSPCDYTTAADLDLDGFLDVVGGNVAYRHDGTILWDRTADFRDGYPAVGDLDRDGRPEVVVVQSAFTPAPYAGDHWLRALNADGTDRWGPVDINAGAAPAADVAAGTVGGGGPATIANFDDDPEPEIALAGAYAYAVFEPNGTQRWASISSDRSSRKTGSSVFDFDGDGISEAIYNDEYWLRVYDGRDGMVRFCLCNTSATLWEYPAIADVDRDGHAEIVLASNDYAWSTCSATPSLGPCEMARIAAGETAGAHGIRVFASPTRDWVGTRRVWNQHTYHITNVTEDGAIPRHERPNWTVPALNDFRTNVQPGATNLPDLVPIDLAVDLIACPSRMVLNFRIENRGWSAVPAGVPVSVYVDPDGTGWVLASRVLTTRSLLPGESEAFSVGRDLPAGDADLRMTFRVVVNDAGDPPPASLTQCVTTNDQAEFVGDCAIVF